MREITDAELNEAVAAMTQLNRNLDRYRRGLEGNWDWGGIPEETADKVVRLIFDAADALDELATEVEGLEQ